MYIVQVRVKAALGRLCLKYELRGHEEREGGADSLHHWRPSRKSAGAEPKPEREPRLEGGKDHSRSHDHGLAAEVDESRQPCPFRAPVGRTAPKYGEAGQGGASRPAPQVFAGLPGRDPRRAGFKRERLTPVRAEGTPSGLLNSVADRWQYPRRDARGKATRHPPAATRVSRLVRGGVGGGLHRGRS
jgi:hypothetical protein